MVLINSGNKISTLIYLSLKTPVPWDWHCVPVRFELYQQLGIPGGDVVHLDYVWSSHQLLQFSNTQPGHLLHFALGHFNQTTVGKSLQTLSHEQCY
jgi:hypothetical protein